MPSSGTLTGAVQSQGRGPFRPICKIMLTWTSTAAGAVNQVVVDGNGNGLYCSGELLRVVFIPGTGGNQPSNNYSAQLTDQNGIDLLAGQGATLSNTTTTHVCPGVKVTDGATSTERAIAGDDKLTLVIGSAGDVKQGQVILYLR